MTPEEFRRQGHALIDWISDYWRRIESFPVLSQVKPGEIRAALPAEAPEQGESWGAIFADFERIILPGVTHWQSPGFFAYFPANASPPSVLGELLAAGLGVQGMLWTTSPACTELETHVLDWLATLLGLPERFRSHGAGGGVIQDGASAGTLCALLAARVRARAALMAGGGTSIAAVDASLVAYASTQTHSSLEKALMIAGLDRARLRLIEVDSEQAMDAAALARTIAADRAAGLVPFFICATLGTTSSLGCDPLRAIGGVAAAEGAWLHVDAAMGGAAMMCPEFRGLQDGVELADSYVTDPHKWLGVNLECSAFYVADRTHLNEALSVLPEYLRNQASASGEVIDYRDWHTELGRRFRALKLWFVLRSYGSDGLRQMIRNHVAWAQELAGWVRASSAFELAATPRLNLVCLRHRGGDGVNEALRDALNAGGRIYLTHTRLDDRVALRVCVGQMWTTRDHVQEAWRLIEATAAQLGSAGTG